MQKTSTWILFTARVHSDEVTEAVVTAALKQSGLTGLPEPLDVAVARFCNKATHPRGHGGGPQAQRGLGLKYSAVRHASTRCGSSVIPPHTEHRGTLTATL